MRASTQAIRSSSRCAASSTAKGSTNSPSGWAAPDRQCLPQPFGRQRRFTRVQELLTLGAQASETGEIDRLAVRDDQIPGRRRQEGAVREQLPQTRDGDLDHLRGGVGDLVAPQVVDQAIGGDRPVGIEEQPRQQGALAASRNRDRTAPIADFERPEEAELHRAKVARATQGRLPARLPRLAAARYRPRRSSGRPGNRPGEFQGGRHDEADRADPQRRGFAAALRHARPARTAARAGDVPVPRGQRMARRGAQPIEHRGVLRRRRGRTPHASEPFRVDAGEPPILLGAKRGGRTPARHLLHALACVHDDDDRVHRRGARASR